MLPGKISIIVICKSFNAEASEDNSGGVKLCS